jgi:general secretion pathway protein D
MFKKNRYKFPLALLTVLLVCLYAHAANPGNYFVQLGSFKVEDHATALKNSIKNTGTSSASVLHGKTYHTVRIGPFKTKKEAVTVKNNLKVAENDAKIINIPKSLNSPSISNNTKSTQKTVSELPVIPSATQDKLVFKKSLEPKEKPKRLWNLQQADIRSVINEIAKETGKNFVIDPRVQGKISIISGHEINADELYQVFLSMLQISGFAAVPSGDVIKILPNIEARSQAGDWRSMTGEGKGDEMIVEVVPVKYVPAEQLVPVLRPLMPQWSNVSAYGPSNALILSGRADNIHRLAYIIKKVDDSSANGIDIVPLNNALAMDVVSTVKNLLDNQKSRNYQRPTMIAADDKSNTVLISGTKTDRLRIRILINELDQTNSRGAGNTEVVYLKYLRAQDLIPILAGVAKANFSGSVGTTIGTVSAPQLDSSTPSNSLDSSGASGAQDTPQPPAPQNIDMGGVAPNTQASSNSSDGDKKPKVEIIAEPNTNSIIISAPNSVMQVLRRIIAKLDARPAQVLIEALIVEIDENDIQQLGIEWGTVSNTDGNSIFKQGFAIINSHTNLSQFQAQIYALITNQRANILSTPSVVVLDNHQAKILVGKEVSIQDSSYPGNSGGAGTTNPYNTFTRQKVALHLYVRPQISHDNNIQLQIDHGNDTLADPADALSGRPVLNISNILTSVMINSGDILVLGGLVQNGLQTKGVKLPILGDLPGVASLFQNNKRTRSKKVLMVFLRPKIITDNSSSLQITGSKYFPAREEQLKWVRKEPYNESNNTILLRDLQKTKIPTPFDKPSPYVSKKYGRRNHRF